MNKINNIGNNMKNNPETNKANVSTFQIMPLDVNVAQMQFKLQKRAELEIPENGDFSPVTEIYNNDDQRVEISNIKVICKCSPENKNEREIIAKIVNRAETSEYTYTLITGTKEQLLDYLNSKDNIFFEIVKQFALSVSEQNKRKF